MYTSELKDSGILFAYDIYPRYAEKIYPVRLQGLDPAALYKIQEICLMPNKKTSLAADGKIYSGDYLMKVGLNIFSPQKMSSKIIKLIKQ
jgi:alpha-galactosidase